MIKSQVIHLWDQKINNQHLNEIDMTQEMSFLKEEKVVFTKEVFVKEDEFHQIYREEAQKTQVLVLELKKLKD